MRVAHITVLPAFSSGIFKKAEEKAKISKKCKLGIDFYIINPEKTLIQDNLFILQKSFAKNRILNKILFKINVFEIIEELVPCEKYECIVLRYALPEGGYENFLKKYGHKIISEHHTNEADELLSTGRVIDKVRYINERLFAKKYLSYVKAIVGVTKEITLIENKKIANPKPTFVMPNGIKVDDIPFTKYKKFDGRELSIIFVASYFYPWHGLDLLLKGLRDYQGEVKIRLELVGEISSKDREQIEALRGTDNIEIIGHGKKYGDELDKIFENVTMAVSSLALFRNKMKEACPIKTREYIARGIPFVYGYDDSDLSGREEFAFKVPTSGYKEKNALNIAMLIDFAKRVSMENNLSEIMRKFADERLSWESKMKSLLVNLQNLT